MEQKKQHLDDTRIEEFRWQKQKFMLVYTTGFTLAFGSLILGYQTFSHSSEFRNFAEKETVALVQRQRMESQMALAQVDDLSAKFKSVQALVTRLDENQQAQAAVLQQAQAAVLQKPTPDELATKLKSLETLVMRLEETQQAQAAVLQKLTPPKQTP